MINYQLDEKKTNRQRIDKTPEIRWLGILVKESLQEGLDNSL